MCILGKEDMIAVRDLWKVTGVKKYSTGSSYLRDFFIVVRKVELNVMTLNFLT